MKTDLFQFCGHCWVFQICWHIECSTFTASSFRIWNSSTGILSLSLALFVVMLSKAHLTSHSRMSGSRSVITPSWLSGSWRSFLYSFSSQDYGFSCGHVWMRELDCEESWVLRNWRFWTVVLDKTLEGPLDCKEIQPVHSKGDQSWVFFAKTDAKAETPILWPPHANSWLIGKDPDAGRDWGQEEKGPTENEMVGWHHQLDGQEFEQAPRVGDGQESLCFSP